MIKLTKFKECTTHGEHGEPDCNECMRNLIDFCTNSNTLVISKDGDMIN